MRSRPMVLAAAALASLALAGPCPAREAGSLPSTARTGSTESDPGPDPIRVGETARFPSQRLLARFVRVVEDSRCPVDVTCVWAGRAVVEVAVSREDSDAPTRLIALEVGSGPVEIYGSRLAATGLEPAPHSERRIAESDYRLELRIVPEDSPGDSEAG